MTPTLFALDHRATYRCTAPTCPNRVTILVEHDKAPRCHNNHPARNMTREETR